MSGTILEGTITVIWVQPEVHPSYGMIFHTVP